LTRYIIGKRSHHVLQLLKNDANNTNFLNMAQGCYFSNSCGANIYRILTQSALNIQVMSKHASAS